MPRAEKKSTETKRTLPPLLAARNKLVSQMYAKAKAKNPDITFRDILESPELKRAYAAIKAKMGK